MSETAITLFVFLSCLPFFFPLVFYFYFVTFQFCSLCLSFVMKNLFVLRRSDVYCDYFFVGVFVFVYIFVCVTCGCVCICVSVSLCVREGAFA